jgi:hypothetical protein
MLHAVVTHTPWQCAWVTNRATLPTKCGVFVAGGHGCAGSTDGGLAGTLATLPPPGPTVTMYPSASSCSFGTKLATRPKSQASEAPFPLHLFASEPLRDAPAARQSPGTQKVKPEART